MLTVEGCSPKTNWVISPIENRVISEKNGTGKMFTISIKRCSLISGVHYERFHCKLSIRKIGVLPNLPEVAGLT